MPKRGTAQVGYAFFCFAVLSELPFVNSSRGGCVLWKKAWLCPIIEHPAIATQIPGLWMTGKGEKDRYGQWALLWGFFFVLLQNMKLL